MDMYSKYQSPLGYNVGENGIDSYGVDHNKFTLQDEVQYQNLRHNREQEVIKQLNEQGITENYPQYGTNFWGGAENNYGFGDSNIVSAVQNHQSLNTTPIPLNNQQPLTPIPTTKPSLTMFTENYTPNTTTQNNGNYISDEDLYARMWKNIKQNEDVISHPYLDTKGLITIGGGANVNDWNVFKNLNVTVDGIPATEAQKLEAYNRMRQLSEEKDVNGNYVNRNLKAKAFENKTNIRISDTEARSLAQSHMNNDLEHLRGEFSDFDSFPLPLKEVLLDIQYNTGNLNQQKWPNLYNAIQNRNVNGIVANVNRKDVQQERNDWTQDMARSIRF